MPIEKGGREPKLTSTAELAAHLLTDLISPRSQVQGKTSTSFEAAQLLAQRADDQILVVDIGSQRPAEAPETGPKAYTPIILDGLQSSSLPVLPGPLREEVRRALGLDARDDHTR
ncbi:ParA family protein [Streptomyces lydicus]|uniref:ParA family protein n=1 Tax=Streptomyces lydicus TaxID=47763 RepID=UPI0010111467|nr:ParA family protein [Streptomyces lydicus]MCZ1011962.1 ParA family protein [Streptomyces lydicus]